MTVRFARIVWSACVATALISAGVVGAQGVAKPKPGDKPPTIRLPGIPQPFNQADIYFMQGMIPHHAQAVKMAGWAESHGASKTVLIICQRTVVGQGDEIKMMREWLSDRGQWVPPADAQHLTMNMGGMVHDMLMPGMLSEAEMAALDKARGKEWDRLFLEGMIKHHQGAIAMVEELFASYGAAQGDDIYKFASDVYADQGIEIEVMKELLAAIK
jgi:uncharacterized protein (DUF305 family)